MKEYMVFIHAPDCPMVRKIEVVRARSRRAALKKMQKLIALGRLGEVQDIADVAVFLASESSKYITGQVLVVDGGMVI